MARFFKKKDDDKKKRRGNSLFKRRKFCRFTAEKIEWIDYKDVELLKDFINENGKITYPVSEITVAGNLLDMFMHLTPGDDLQIRYGMDAPTILIEGMTIAGE